eukprot:10190428-Ditylum_brightwellii.AAC.1
MPLSDVFDSMLLRRISQFRTAAYHDGSVHVNNLILFFWAQVANSYCQTVLANLGISVGMCNNIIKGANL